MSTPPFVTPEDIHAARPDLSLETIRRHCRPGGPLAGGAQKIGRSWAILADVAAGYAEHYEHNEGSRRPPAPAS